MRQEEPKKDKQTCEPVEPQAPRSGQEAEKESDIKIIISI